MGRNRWSAVSVPCHMDENMKANGAVPLGKAGTYHLSHYPSPSFLGESDRAGWFVVYKHRTKSLLWRLYIVLVCAFSFFFLLFFFFHFLIDNSICSQLVKTQLLIFIVFHLPYHLRGINFASVFQFLILDHFSELFNMWNKSFIASSVFITHYLFANIKKCQ